MLHIEIVDGWEGRSTDRHTGFEHPDHQSHLSESSVLSLVRKSKALLETLAPDPPDPAPAMVALQHLKAAWYAPDFSDLTLYVVKGLHQRESNPHLRLQLGVTARGRGTPFHLDLTQETVTQVENGVPYTAFKWRPLRFGAEVDAHEALWPPHATRATPWITRRLSISKHMPLAERVRVLVEEQEATRLAAEKAQAQEAAERDRRARTSARDRALTALKKELNGWTCMSQPSALDGAGCRFRPPKGAERTFRWVASQQHLVEVLPSGEKVHTPKA